MPVKILVVEDDLDWQMRFRERLVGWGYEVVLAGDKSEGQLKLHDAQNGFDILLIDPSLTDSGDDRDGLDFLIGLRNKSINIPAIIFTSLLDKKLLQDLVNDFNEYNIVGALDKKEFGTDLIKVLEMLRKAEKKIQSKNQTTKVFISYSHQDKSFAKRLADKLENMGMKIWWDFDSLRGGQDWQKEIESGIKQCDFFLVILTPNAVASEWVGNEITYAIHEEKTIIPLHLKKCNVPIGLIKKQWIDFQKQSWNSAIKELLRILEI